MIYDHHLMIFTLMILLPSAVAVAPNHNTSRLSPPILLPQNARHLRRDTNVSSNTTSSSESFVWIIEDTYDASNFFESFTFFTGPDPTHGTVTYVDNTTAFAQNLSYISWDGKVIMKGDDTTTLQAGQNRESVRVSSNKIYNTGLFVLDINRAPWGCGVWPAFWTLGDGLWPTTGEIDIIEGVHDNEHNQVTWHTNPGCNLTPSNDFTGTILDQNGQQYLDCEGSATLPGCGVIEWSQASYGPTFDAQGGGVFAMKWDQDGISVWNFYRVAVPDDIQQGFPDPSTWPEPTATLEPAGCNPLEYFQNHTIIFDITFCGDWAGNTYNSSGCPGTCAEVLLNPANFVNASWSINSLKVYRRQDVKVVSAGTLQIMQLPLPFSLAIAMITVLILAAL